MEGTELAEGVAAIFPYQDMVVSSLELVKTFAKPLNGTRSSIRKFPTGKQDFLFRSSTFSGTFPVERTEKSCSIYNLTGISGISW